jgi:hypothetical protein
MPAPTIATESFVISHPREAVDIVRQQIGSVARHDYPTRLQISANE